MANKDRISWMVWPTSRHEENDEVYADCLGRNQFKDPVTAMTTLLNSDEPDGLYSIDTFDGEDDDPFVAGFTVLKTGNKLELSLEYDWRGLKERQIKL